MTGTVVGQNGLPSYTTNQRKAVNWRYAKGTGGSSCMEYKMRRKEGVDGWWKRYEKEEKEGLRRLCERRRSWPFSEQEMSLWLSMLGIFASQHWQIYFITKDAEPKWVNKMSLSMACQSTPRVTNIWLVFSLQIIPVALLRFCFFHISWHRYISLLMCQMQ